jgi:glycosyltransferase involved in cell wall biosynthesis
MAQLGCVLVDASGQRDPEALRQHLHDLRDLLGPRAPVEVWWNGGSVPGLPPGVRLLTRSGARALAQAAAHAATSSGHLLVLLGAVLPDSSVVQALLTAFDLDPMVGFSQPRFGDTAHQGIWSLPGNQQSRPELLSRGLLPALLEHYLTTERLSACLAIRREAVAAFAVSPDSAEDLTAALQQELCLARRRGFRNLVLNRAVVTTAAPYQALYPSPDQGSWTRLVERFPDAARAEDWFTGGAHQRFERIAVQARRARADAPLPVLLDCRGARTHHNGTSQAILGLLEGLKEQAPRWGLDVLFDAEPAEYHQVSRRFPEMRLATRLRDRTYAAAVRLDQPWHMSTVAELHRRACVVSFNMLDTISWDVVYVGDREMELTWRFIADHADGLLYNSAFTRDRFGFRFPVAAEVLQTVTHHGIETAKPAPSSPPDRERPHLLVFGNRYEHKAVASTVDLLTRAFPYQPIWAIGLETENRHNVTAVPSGKLADAEIERLTGTAAAVVFPSFYEGFGLPVLKALAYGRPVVVRASPLWREIAGITRGPGRLLEFVAPHELVEAVGQVLAGQCPAGLPMGTALSGDPPTWRDCAGRLVSHVEQLAASFDPRRWYAREHTLQLARI